MIKKNFFEHKNIEPSTLLQTMRKRVFTAHTCDDCLPPIYN